MSLFSGVGGFDLGFEQAGFTTAFQCEWDKHATRILERHWPDVPKWGDVQTLTGDEILRHCQTPDVIIWGSPCQDLSVAGKRAGLSGERSGLFHEGIRIINELREATDGRYPRVSVWENVAGALNSNRGADFGTVLDQMAEAGAVVIEWALLDAQHFGVPQRRRRVFVVAVFDPATAERCPDPLLPVGEGVRGDSAKSRKKGQATAGQTAQGVRDSSQWPAGEGSSGELRQSISAKWSTGHSGPSGDEYVNLVVGTLQAHDATKWGSHQWVAENKMVVEPFVKSGRAQNVNDDETWIPGDINPTLNQFDTGDTRTTTAIIQPIEPIFFDPSRRDGARIQEQGTINTLQSFMGTGGNNTPMVAQPIGLQGNMIGRQPENGPAGKGYTDDGDPMFTLTSTDVHAVAYPIQDGREIEKQQNGLGIGGENDPAYTLDQTGAQSVVQYDGYNQKVHTDDISVTLRIGRDSSDFIAQPTGATAFQPGTMIRLGGGVWDEMSPTLRAEAKRGDNEPHIATGMAVRRLTPLECERLMGWPDGWTDGQADSHRYRQCGNGVATPVARWIANHIKPTMEDN